MSPQQLSRFLRVAVDKEDAKKFDLSFLVGQELLSDQGDPTELGRAFLRMIEQMSPPQIVYINPATGKPVYERGES